MRSLRELDLIWFTTLITIFRVSCRWSFNCLETKCCWCIPQYMQNTTGTTFFKRAINPLYLPIIDGAPSVAQAIIFSIGLLFFLKYETTTSKIVSPFVSVVRFLTKSIPPLCCLRSIYLTYTSVITSLSLWKHLSSWRSNFFTDEILTVFLHPLPFHHQSVITQLSCFKG